MNQEQNKPWSPIALNEVLEVFRNAPFFWCVAGGYAIELAIGTPVRRHGDTDILIFRKDHLALQNHLADWDCWVADPPGTLRPWPQGAQLELGVHDIWCRRNDAWEMQIMLDESTGDAWYSRRHYAVTAPIEDLTRISASGIPYLAPHIQLFYKAKSLREKDEADLNAVLAGDVDLDRDWLCIAITTAYGDDHPWLPRLNRTVG